MFAGCFSGVSLAGARRSAVLVGRASAVRVVGPVGEVFNFLHRLRAKVDEHRHEVCVMLGDLDFGWTEDVHVHVGRRRWAIDNRTLD